MTHVQVISISRKYLLQAIEVPKVKDALEFLKQQPVRMFNNKHFNYASRYPKPTHTAIIPLYILKAMGSYRLYYTVP